MKAEISVIMSVYNGEEYLGETIDSIIAQTFREWELIVINDCSTDKTAEILEKYALMDERIKVHINEVNLRLPTSLNKAVSLAQGKYIARMDADDICFADRLEKQYNFMESNPDISLSSCRFLTLKNGVYSSGGCGGRCDNEAIRAMLLVTNPILHPGVIARAEVMKELGYDTSLTCTEDLELWTRFAKNNYKMQIQPEYLMIYRLHDKQITGTTLKRQHEEVVKIEKQYYQTFLEEMSDTQWGFYINGIYFKEDMDIDKFCEFYKWIKAVNKKEKSFSAVDYAAFEILAEYKRCQITKKELIKAMMCFNPLFLAKELYCRKKRAYDDGRRCIEAAKQIGLTQTSGTAEFPIFSKVNE
ncbi:MAG: glycosyltransferase [Clostridia bacterium]|nr:glycosyltransferase [Clostridia bacterium]